MFKKNASSKLLQWEQRLAYLLLLPTFVVLIVVALYPLGLVFVTSFTDRTFASPREPNYVGLNNYTQLLGMTIRELPPLIDEETGLQVVDPKTGGPLYERPLRVLPREPRRYREVTQFSLFGKRYVLGATDPDFIKAVRDTLVFTVVSVLLETILGLGIALVVNSPFKGRGVIRAAMLVPWAVITVVSARMWQWMLAPTRVGVINVIFQMLGLGDGNIAFLTQPEWQLPSIIMVDVWKTTPFMALLLLAGLQLIPDELYEAARVDGAGPMRQFISITMPLLRPTMAVALVFRTLDALRVFDVFQVMLAQSRYSMASYNYYQLIGNRAMGKASAIGVIIFIFIFIFAVLYIRMLGVETD
ncbi:carbohydrate ABC transporter permease [Candidatus Sordicultor fermentans]|uniref:carbohydrate ABC transporter permease n=1 Tax=Candidatus Sordicultor fermentans TaxID=1953203 RepID=UPI0016B6DC51|nr:sugar ABC transporter permease [Candidatus Atribacteria bacterium]